MWRQFDSAIPYFRRPAMLQFELVRDWCGQSALLAPEISDDNRLNRATMANAAFSDQIA